MNGIYIKNKNKKLIQFLVKQSYRYKMTSRFEIALFFPHSEFCLDHEAKDKFILSGSVILDQIWKLRNQNIHDGGNVNVARAL